MARSEEERRRRSQRYGRRHRLLRALGTEEEATMIEDLLAELRRSGVPRDEQARLRSDLKRHSDISRRRSALWAIVDALEQRGG